MHASRKAALSLAALGLAAALSAGPPAAAQTAQAGRPLTVPASALKPSAFALSQIGALQAEKAGRTPAQRKIDSNLLRAALLARPAPLPGTPQAHALPAGILALLATIPPSAAARPDANGRVLVDIKGEVSRALLSRIAAAGGTVIGSWPAYGAIRASLPIAQVEAVAALPAVLSVRTAEKYRLARTRPAPFSPGPLSPGPLVPGLPPLAAPVARTEAQREARVKAILPSLLAHLGKTRTPGGLSAPTSASLASLLGGIGGLNTTDPEGDSAHRAALARQTFHVNGSGVKIGILSSSVDGLAQEQRKGALGPVTVLPGQSGVPGSGEGTAMLEIVHRLAPGAQLYFATADPTEENFASNILALKKAGCNVIVDDVMYFLEPPFQDGIIAQAVDTVSAAGAFYFSSAGNEYNVDQGGGTYLVDDQGVAAGPHAASTWEGDFTPSGQTITVNGGKPQPLLAFDPAGDFGDQVLTVASPAYVQQFAILYWADPQAPLPVTDDYDLYVFDPTFTQILFASTDTHDGTPGQIPVQACESDQGDQIVVTLNHGNPVMLHLLVPGDGAAALRIATPGSTFGHNSAASAYGTAAVDASIASAAGRSFQSTDVTETFSSDGPRHIIFNADGTEITPGNRTSTGGVVRQKPVLAAADGVTTFFNPFYGTSAGAPHAAAIAGLVLSANPSLAGKQAQMFSLLTTSCIPIDTAFGPLPNRDTGYGLLDAYTAVQNAVGP